MPRATVNINETQRFDLKTCPEGYVTLRRLSYGQKLQRQAMAGRMKFTASGGKDFEGEMALAQEQVSLFEFANCIVDHNLTDEDDKPLDFKNPLHVKMIEGRIGEEIDSYISKMNNFEEDQGNS